MARANTTFNRLIKDMPSNKKYKIAFSTEGKENANIELMEEDHNALVEHITECVTYCDSLKAQNEKRYKYVDKGLSGKVKYSAEDLIRVRNTREGKAEAPATVRPAKAEVHIEKAAGNILTMLQNDNKLYGFTPKVSDTAIVTAVNDEMNDIGEFFRHKIAWRALIKDALSYNMACAEVVWSSPFDDESDENAGTQPRRGMPESVFSKTNALPAGSVQRRLSPYNVFYDISLDDNITAVPEQGRFAGYSELMSWFEMQSKVESGYFADPHTSHDSTKGDNKWYTDEPDTVNDNEESGNLSLKSAYNRVNHKTPVGRQSAMNDTEQFNCYVVTTMYVRLKPKRFNLKKKDANKLFLYKFVVLNGARIVRIELLGDRRETIPMCFGRAINASKGSRGPTLAELILPYQDLAAFELNLRISAGRRELNSNVLIMDDRLKPTNHQEKANVVYPLYVNSNKLEKDAPLSSYVYSSNVAPVTYQTTQNIQILGELMNEVLPADQAQKMAELNRANIYQAAQVHKTTSETNVNIATELDSQLFSALRFLTFKQFVNNVSVIRYTDDVGQVQDLETSTLYNKVFMASAMDGLAGVDKFYTVESFKEILIALLQSPQANTNIDMNKVIGAQFDLMGLPYDFNSLKFQTEFDALPLEIKQQLFNYYQQQLQAQEQAQAQGGTPGGPGQGQPQPPQ